MVILGIVNALLEVVGVSVLLHTVMSILQPEFIEHNIFTRYIAHKFGLEEQLPFVVLISVLLLFVYVVKNIVIIYFNKKQIDYAFDVTDDLSNRRFKKIARHDLLYFKNRNPNDVINELFGALMFLPETIVLPSLLLLSELAIVAVLLLAVLFYHPFLFVFIFLSVVPAGLILIYVNRKKLGTLGRDLHNISPKVFQNIHHLAKGISDIKLWVVTDHFHEVFQSNKDKFFKLKNILYLRVNFIPVKIYEVVAILGVLCIVLFVYTTNDLTANLVGYISLYAGISFRLLPSVNRIIASYNQLSTNEYRLDYFVEDESTEKGISEESKIPNLEFNDELSLENISFGYDTAKVLRNLSLKINKGEFIGIIGQSGSGKTTLINIITSLIKPNLGNVNLDSNTITDKEKDAYRLLFSYVKQEVFMLNESIRDNIVFFQDSKADEEKIYECLRLVNLKDWIASLPGGIETQVGDLGTRISGGQKQRIAIARALYKEAEIFIFDEATNNLDKESISQTLDAIKTLKNQGKTAIFITHKPDELKMCDVVYKLQGGQLSAVQLN